MVHMGNGVMKIAFGTNATVFRNLHLGGYKGSFSYCENEDINELGVPIEFPVKNERLRSAAADDFKLIPGSPIAYWVNTKFRELFQRKKLKDTLALKAGMSTGDNDKFQRLWFEVSIGEIDFEGGKTNHVKWFPCNSGGEFRRWYGNNLTIVNWQNDGYEIRNNKDVSGRLKSAPRNVDTYFKEGITWTKLSSGRFAARYMEKGFAFDDTGRSGFVTDSSKIPFILASMNSVLTHEALLTLAPTMSFTSNELANIPIVWAVEEDVARLSSELIEISKNDWDSFERSWNFKKTPLMAVARANENIAFSII
jgi:hypothetical protein